MAKWKYLSKAANKYNYERRIPFNSNVRYLGSQGQDQEQDKCFILLYFWLKHTPSSSDLLLSCILYGCTKVPKIKNSARKKKLILQPRKKSANNKAKHVIKDCQISNKTCSSPSMRTSQRRMATNYFAICKMIPAYWYFTADIECSIISQKQYKEHKKKLYSKVTHPSFMWITRCHLCSV